VQAAHDGSTLGLDVLTCDPVMELVYQAGMLPLKDLRSVMLCLDTEVGRRGLLLAAGL
jgi:hypothetical protein